MPAGEPTWRLGCVGGLTRAPCGPPRCAAGSGTSVFSDEKLFSIQASFNHQNDRVLATDSRNVPDKHRRVFRTQKPASVMVWAAVSQAGKSPLVFVPEGVKINKETYIETILEQTLKPWAKKRTETRAGLFSRTAQQATPRASPNSGAKTTAQASSPRTSGPHHPQI